jgi:hypothetical protein
MAAIGSHAHCAVACSDAAAGLSPSARGSAATARAWSEPGSPGWTASWSAGRRGGGGGGGEGGGGGGGGGGRRLDVLCPFRKARGGEIRGRPVQRFLRRLGHLSVPGRARRGRTRRRLHRPRARDQPAPRLTGRLAAERGPPRRPRRGLHGPAINDLPAGRAGRWRAMHPDRVDHVHLDHRRPGHPVIADWVDETDREGVSNDLGPVRAGVHDPGDHQDRGGGHHGDVIAPLYRQVHQDDDGDDEPRPGQDEGSRAAENLRLVVRVIA